MGPGPPRSNSRPRLCERDTRYARAERGTRYLTRIGGKSGYGRAERYGVTVQGPELGAEGGSAAVAVAVGDDQPSCVAETPMYTVWPR